jgi:dihydroxy-acid dehydratase
MASSLAALRINLRQARPSVASRQLQTSAAAMNQPIMNRWSRTVTQPKSQGASQAMLYATDGIVEDDDFNKAMVGVASVW